MPIKSETSAWALLPRVESEHGADSVEVADVIDVLVEARWRNNDWWDPRILPLAERAVGAPLSVRETRADSSRAMRAASWGSLLTASLAVSPKLFSWDQALTRAFSKSSGSEPSGWCRAGGNPPGPRRTKP